MSTETIDSPVEAAEPKKAKPEPKPCACASYTAHADGKELSTNCTALTPRNFAPGHDAKLKSLLIKAAVAGVDVAKSNDTGEVTEVSPLHAAEDFGFRPQVEKGVETDAKVKRAKADKAEARKEAADKRAADRAAAKAAREEKAAQRKADREQKAADAKEQAATENIAA